MRVVVWLACLPWLLFGQETKKEVSPVPVERRADTYAIYSAVMARPSLSHPDNNEKYAIAELSGLATEEKGLESCIAVPEGYRAAFAELQADRTRHREDRFRLERAFNIPKPYEVLTQAQSTQFLAARSGTIQTTVEPEPFPGAIDLITLGNVYFDQKRTLAAVYTAAYCGSLCGFWTWRVFVKNGKGDWEEQHWTKCMTIAGRTSQPTRSAPSI
jgi:hypothetical protein